MKKPAAGTAGKVEIHAINLGPSAGGNQSLVSHEVLDLESRPILNNEKIHPESEPRQSHFSRPHRSRRGRMRRQSGRVPAVQAGLRHVHSLSWDNDRVQDELITWQIAKDNGNKPIRNGGAKGFKKAIAALEEQGLGERLQVGTVWAFKASKPWP